MLIQALHRFLDALLFTQEEISTGYAPSGIPTAIFSYEDPRVRRLVWNIKYRGNKKLAAYAGEVLRKRLLEALDDTYIRDGEKMLLVPVPSSRRKKRIRGHNQAELLVKAMLRHDALGVFAYGKDIVVKIKETRNQAELTRSERMTNLIGAFAVPCPEKARGRSFAIIDDVTTTGSTFNEMKKVLLEAGAEEVAALALAH